MSNVLVNWWGGKTSRFHYTCSRMCNVTGVSIARRGERRGEEREREEGWVGAMLSVSVRVSEWVKWKKESWCAAAEKKDRMRRRRVQQVGQTSDTQVRLTRSSVGTQTEPVFWLKEVNNQVATFHSDTSDTKQVRLMAQAKRGENLSLLSSPLSSLPSSTCRLYQCMKSQPLPGKGLAHTTSAASAAAIKIKGRKEEGREAATCSSPHQQPVVRLAAAAADH